MKNNIVAQSSKRNRLKTPPRSLKQQESMDTTPLTIRLQHLEYSNKKPRIPLTPLSVSLTRIQKHTMEQIAEGKKVSLKDQNQTPKKVGLQFTKALSETPAVKTGIHTSTVKSVNLTTPRATEFSDELKKVLNERNILTSKTRKCVFDALDEIKNKGQEESRQHKRQKAVLEITNTEITYVHQLEKIINFFLKPTQDRKLLRNEDFQTIFGNILSIYNINKELLKELEDSPDEIAKAFWRIAPFLKVYSVYACDFKNILNLLQNVRSLNPQFAKFLENQESRPEVQSKLSALLITPIQRVPRYKLLLTQLLELTKPTEIDYEDLKECLERIEEAAEHINKVVDDHENMQRLIEIQRILKSGEPVIVKPGRTLIKEGILIKMATKDAPSEKLFTVLMNDIILFCKTKKDEFKVNSLKCLSIFPLGKCKVLEILDKGCMRIICQQEELILYNEQLQETQNWIYKIKECIELHVNDRKTLRKDSSSRRPVKRKDLHEYHEVGLSPGKPLKKRKLDSQSAMLGSKVSGRKSIKSVNVPISMVRDQYVNTEQQSTQSENEHNPVPTVSNELFIFGRPQTDKGFKVGNIFNGVGTSIKRFFGFRS